MEIDEIDIGNIQVVGVHQEDIVIMGRKPKMSKDEALVHAAWLVALADESENYERFRAILKRVLNT